MGGRLRGLDERSNTFWSVHQKAGRRFYARLKTDDYVQAVQKGSVFLRTPSLNPTQGLRPDIEAFLDHQREHHLFTTATADSKGAISRQFGASSPRSPARPSFGLIFPHRGVEFLGLRTWCKSLGGSALTRVA